MTILLTAFEQTNYACEKELVKSENTKEWKFGLNNDPMFANSAGRWGLGLQLQLDTRSLGLDVKIKYSFIQFQVGSLVESFKSTPISANSMISDSHKLVRF